MWVKRGTVFCSLPSCSTYILLRMFHGFHNFIILNYKIRSLWNFSVLPFKKLANVNHSSMYILCKQINFIVTYWACACGLVHLLSWWMRVRQNAKKTKDSVMFKHDTTAKTFFTLITWCYVVMLFMKVDVTVYYF